MQDRDDSSKDLEDETDLHLTRWMDMAQACKKQQLTTKKTYVSIKQSRQGWWHHPSFPSFLKNRRDLRLQTKCNAILNSLILRVQPKGASAAKSPQLPDLFINQEILHQILWMNAHPDQQQSNTRIMPLFNHWRTQNTKPWWIHWDSFQTRFLINTIAMITEDWERNIYTQMAKACNYVNRLLMKSEDTEMTHITTKDEQIVMTHITTKDEQNVKTEWFNHNTSGRKRVQSWEKTRLP